MLRNTRNCTKGFSYSVYLSNVKLTLLIVLAATLAILAIAAPTLSQVDDDATFLTSLQTQLQSSMHEDDIILVRYIRITQPAGNHLCFSWLACYDQAERNVCVDRNGKNGQGQHTSSGNGNPHGDPWGLSAPVLSSVENTGEQTGNCYCSASSNAGNYWQVDLGTGIALKQLKFRTRNDSPSYGFNVVIAHYDKVFVTLISIWNSIFLTNLSTNRTTTRSTKKALGSPRQPAKEQRRRLTFPIFSHTKATTMNTYLQSYNCWKA